MDSGKAPRLGGFLLTYYQAFTDQLVSHLVGFCNALLDGESLPVDSLLAHIALIPKEGRDGTDCAHSRPISLISVIPALGHCDKVGSIPNREARDDTCRAPNWIHMARSGALTISADFGRFGEGLQPSLGSQNVQMLTS